ncbi:MAG: YgiT-type zinc finger protein [Anaerolineales bacterium]|nr:YgiT-type zinc finger protein [Anaerolineales bacterium]
MSDDPSTEKYTCPECAAGSMSLRQVTYFTWLHGELITVPDFPAWVCDVCGLREYDARAVSWLNTLLSPGTGRSSRKPGHRPTPRPPVQPNSR